MLRAELERRHESGWVRADCVWTMRRSCCESLELAYAFLNGMKMLDHRCSRGQRVKQQIGNQVKIEFVIAGGFDAG